jgi:peptidoglycan/LPS O-acetylase OafA/YrhL
VGTDGGTVVDAPAGPVARVPVAVANRFPGYDGLRAIAALTVFVFHISNADLRPLQHWYGRYLLLLNIGVPIFFVISGFLLYRPFVAARFEGRSRPTAREFLRRRALRILPAFWVALTVLCIVFNVGGEPGRGFKWGIVNYGLLQTFVETSAKPGIDVAWTICTEVMFYVFLPFYAALLARGTRSNERQLRRELAGIAALFAVALAWRIYFAHGGPTPSALHWYRFQNNVYLPASTDFFAGGMLLAVLSAWHAATDVPRWARSRWLAPAAVTTAVGAYVWYVERVSRWTHNGREAANARIIHHVLFVLIAIALAVPATFGPPGKGLFRRVVESRTLRWVALGSFGIYLYHLPMIQLVYDVTGAERAGFGTVFPHGFDYPFVLMVVLSGIATGLCAAASYVLVERPFLRRKRPRRVVAERSPA